MAVEICDETLKVSHWDPQTRGEEILTPAIVTDVYQKTGRGDGGGKAEDRADCLISSRVRELQVWSHSPVQREKQRGGNPRPADWPTREPRRPGTWKCKSRT